MNKKSIGIIIAVVFVLLVGLVCGTDQDVNEELSATEVSASVDNSEYNLNPNSTESNYENKTETINNTTEKAEPKTTEKSADSGNYRVGLGSIPEFSGKSYVVVNNNVPGFSKADQTSVYFEKYTVLDSLGRCGVAFGCLGRETMPTEERGPIGSVKPSGWKTVKYDFVDVKYLYNRCHLIGFQLSAENANTRNLITGTRYMNVQGMLPFENMVADYIKETGNHVLYRVTPVFKGSELVCRGVQIEAFSVEDNGDGVCFNVYCYNNQPGVIIDYATGGSYLDKSYEATEKQTTETPKTTSKETTQENVYEDSGDTDMVWLPKNGKRYHCISTCSGMNSTNKVSVEEAKAMGYTPCGRCY